MAFVREGRALVALALGLCLLVLGIALPCALTACSASPWGPVTPGQAFVVLGAQRQFTISVLQVDGTPLAVSPTWTVTGGIGTVDASGVFTAGNTPGSGEVIATVGTLSERAEVTVGSTPPGDARRLGVSPETLMLDADETDRLVAVYRPDGVRFAWYTDVTVSDAESPEDRVTVTPATGTENATVVVHIDAGVRAAELRFASLTSGSASVAVHRSAALGESHRQGAAP